MCRKTFAALVALACLAAGAGDGSGAEPTSPTPGAYLRLEDLERLALANNPTLAQAEAAVRAARGERLQAGVWPNPLIGYQWAEVRFRDPGQSKHQFFVEQTFVTAGKLSHGREVAFRKEAVTEAPNSGSAGGAI